MQIIHDLYMPFFNYLQSFQSSYNSGVGQGKVTGKSKPLVLRLELLNIYYIIP